MKLGGRIYQGAPRAIGGGLDFLLLKVFSTLLGAHLFDDVKEYSIIQQYQRQKWTKWRTCWGSGGRCPWWRQRPPARLFFLAWRRLPAKRQNRKWQKTLQVENSSRFPAKLGVYNQYQSRVKGPRYGEAWCKYFKTVKTKIEKISTFFDGLFYLLTTWFTSIF